MEKRYSDADICEMLEKAQRLGYSLEANSPLEDLTVGELDDLVNGRPN